MTYKPLFIFFHFTLSDDSNRSGSLDSLITKRIPIIFISFIASFTLV